MESESRARPSPGDLYEQMCAEYGAALGRLAHAYENDSDRRRDLLQEIHLQLWRSFHNFHARCSLRTWIYRVAHNVAASYVIRQSKTKRSAPAFLTLEEAEAWEEHNPRAGRQDIEISADRRQALARLLALVQRLELIDRQVILAYLEGLDAESIGEITGFSAANVWTRIHRIKNLLARQFHTRGRHVS